MSYLLSTFVRAIPSTLPIYVSGQIKANDSSLQLLGETQDEDRRLIADLVVQKMHQFCRPPGTQLSARPAVPATAPPFAANVSAPASGAATATSAPGAAPGSAVASAPPQPP